MNCLRGGVLAVTAALGALSGAQTFRLVKSTFLDLRGMTGVGPISAAASADGGGYSASNIDGLLLAKYDSAGALQWQQRLGGAYPSKVQEGATGVYVSGDVRRIFSGGFQAFVLKYDFAGNLVFSQFIGSPPGLVTRQMMLDASDNVFLLASTPSDSYEQDAFLVKLDTKGNVLWQTKIGDFAFTTVNSMHRDSAGNFYITGTGVRVGWGTESFVAKLDQNGGRVWQYRVSGYPLNYSAANAVPAPDGSIYVASITENNAQGLRGTQVQKLSAAGAKLWSVEWSGSWNDIVAVDGAGNCFLSASSYVPSTIKVSPSGTVLWNEPLLGYVYDSATDASGNLTLLEGANSFGTPGAVKVGPNGNILWTLDAPDDIGTKEFSRGDIMVSRPYIDGSGNADRTTVVTRRLNGAKTVLWTSAGITNDHGSEFDGGQPVTGGVNASGTLMFWSEHRFIGIDSNGQTTFNVPDGTSFMDGTDLYRATQVLPTRDGGFISNLYDFKLRKYGPTGLLQWELSLAPSVGTLSQRSYGFASEDASGNLYVQSTVDVNTHQVKVTKIGPSGAVVWQSLLPPPPNVAYGGGPTAVDSAGNVFTEFNGELWKLNSAGSIQWHTPLPLNNGSTPAYGFMTTDPSGNLYITSNRYSSGTTQGWITKFTANGAQQFDTVLAVGDNSPVSSTLCYKGRIYSVGTTQINGITMMTVFCLDAQTGSQTWLATPNPGANSVANRVMVDETNDELRIAGSRHSNGGGYDYVLVGMNLNGIVTRAAAYDSGSRLNEYFDGAGSDSQHNYYLFGRANGPSGTYDYNVVKFALPPPDWAAIDPPQIVTKMAKGTSYSGTVRVTNTGLNTWTAAAGYRLDCVQGSTWSLTSVPLASGDTIAPGQTKVFSFTVTAPATTGAYPLTFRMEHSGTQFDNASPSLGISVLTQNNFADFVGQSVPTAMVAGQSYFVSVQYKNTGANTWTPGTGYKLQSMNPIGNTTWGTNRLTLATSSVAPGATGTFSGTVLAPMASGTYNFQWQPIQDTTGLAFGSPSPNVAIAVTNVGDAARYISKTGALTVNAGSDFYVQNTMMNVGSNTWQTANGYSLRSLYNNWGSLNMYMPAPGSLAPGAQVTFTRLLTAPITPGTYPMQWQMLHGSTLFGDKTPYLAMNVVQGPYNARFGSQSVLSTSVGPGTTFGCTFNMQNLGTSTWDSTVKLVSIGSSAFGVPSIPVTGSVAQNANAGFTATFTAPTTPGTYTFQFRMANPSGTKFGQATPLVTVTVSDDAAQFLSKTGPLTVNAGSDFYVQNTFKNTGTTTWSSASGFALRSINPLDNLTWGRNRIYLPGSGSIAPGGSVTLTGLCTAPTTPGTYVMQWQMNHNGALFGEKTPALTITVVQSADNANFLTQTVVPISVVHGSTFPINIAMQNVGTATWGAGYGLVPIGSNAWGLTNIPSGAVPPGGQHTFSATCTAPATPGTYTFQMRMDHNGTKFGQATKFVTITVT